MLEDIRKPILAELESYQQLFRSSLQSDNALLSAALEHLTRKLLKRSLKVRKCYMLIDNESLNLME